MRRVFAGAFAVLLLAGCAVGPNYKRPPLAVPDQTRGQPDAAEAASLADRPWWDLFPDETLRGLIDEALANGYDVRIAAARVEEARANAGIARAPLYPQLQYSGQWSRQLQSGVAFGIENIPPITLYDVNIGASWEIDLFGRIRRSSEAALAQYLSSESARRGVMLALVAQVATQYFQLRNLDRQLEIAKRTAGSFSDTYDLFRRRLEGGAASALETASADASLSIVQAQIPLIESQIVDQENLVSLLLGRNPGPIARGSALSDQAIAPDIPTGLPSALLERRPDLRQAEQDLVAANAFVGVAMANFFPTISLTAAFGGVSTETSNLFTAGKVWSIAAGIVGPIFQGFRLKNEYDASVARWEQAKTRYEQAVTSAFGEVSSTLVAHQKLAEAETQQARAVANYQQAVQLSNDRYLAGLASYLDVLQAEQQLYPAELTLSQTRYTRLANLARLYRALGGGWNLEDPAWIHPPAGKPAS